MSADHSISSRLLLLPLELLTYIFDILPNRDLKSARLTCRGLGNAIRLRIDRVFISANPRNVEVARAIADDENYRRGVVEVIWDDSLLQDDGNDSADSSDDSDSQDDGNDGPPKITDIVASTGATPYLDTNAGDRYLVYNRNSWVSYDDAITF
ncbi:uncharacterized protein TRUGW13939_08139 [Talaromyces rugulosus]|uniref:F-box domain-containing protein n=1 Tax=Talaromyces rugulosus TaxID=121627 RepID=A0A7H8R8A8_TALRU|nr:uncharacterized protein TRUGW13939_08139 [Talaromyces rugulosus]QKX60993.1 hypothetical protein TRUGW13939_08139 [Talaromyces rugulosus]